MTHVVTSSAGDAVAYDLHEPPGGTAAAAAAPVVFVAGAGPHRRTR